MLGTKCNGLPKTHTSASCWICKPSAANRKNIVGENTQMVAVAPGAVLSALAITQNTRSSSHPSSVERGNSRPKEQYKKRHGSFMVGLLVCLSVCLSVVVYLLLVVPDGAASLLLQPRVVAASPAVGAHVVPHLRRRGRQETVTTSPPPPPPSYTHTHTRCTIRSIREVNRAATRQSCWIKTKRPTTFSLSMATREIASPIL